MVSDVEKQVRILVTTPVLSKPGGVANYFEKLRDHFRMEVDYFPVGSPEGVEHGGALVLRMIRDYWAFYKQLRARDYDLVHLNPSLLYGSVLRDGLFLVIARAQGRPVVVFFRGWDPNCETLIRNYFSGVFRLVYFRADAFIALATEFRDKLCDMGYTKPIYLETTVVEQSIILRGDRALGISGGREVRESPNILFLSRIERDKGIYEAIEAHRLVREKVPSATLTIAGDGPELESVREYLREERLAGIEVAGFLRNEAKGRAFENADLFLFPTYFGEGMPNAVLEAMAYGLPVITRSVGGLADFFEDGKMGFIIGDRNPSAFANRAIQLIQDPVLRETIGRYNINYARKNFAAPVVAARLEAIYKKVLQYAPGH